MGAHSASNEAHDQVLGYSLDISLYGHRSCVATQPTLISRAQIISTCKETSANLLGKKEG
jgi:hypothetical protein